MNSHVRLIGVSSQRWARSVALLNFSPGENTKNFVRFELNVFYVLELNFRFYINLEIM
jgi:hypothetical protein